MGGYTYRSRKADQLLAFFVCGLLRVVPCHGKLRALYTFPRVFSDEK